MLRGQRHLIQNHQQAAILLAGEHGVLLHLAQTRCPPDGSRDRLEPVVESIEHEVLRVIEKSFRPAGDGVLRMLRIVVQRSVLQMNAIGKTPASSNAGRSPRLSGSPNLPR